MTERQRKYVGRFAPSPSGPLHLGSLLTALASFLDARANGGEWLLRIEDIDPPREDPNAGKAIIQSLLDHGLWWDGEIIWQSKHQRRFESELEGLLSSGHVFPCSCSRRQLASHGGLHRGECIVKPDPENFALRLRAEDRQIAYTDRIQGVQMQNLKDSVGDMILKRRDGLYAYQLAVVVDDRDELITDIVRGSDLMETTPGQLFLQERLGAPSPRYLHLPVLTSADGLKLSKQRQAPAIVNQDWQDNLRRCLGFLGQSPPPPATSPGQLLSWAIEHWQVTRIPPLMAISAT